MNGALVEAVDEEADQTEKWTVPEELRGGEMTAPIAVAAELSRAVGDRHRCRTLLSPIPSLLARTMRTAPDQD